MLHTVSQTSCICAAAPEFTFRFEYISKLEGDSLWSYCMPRISQTGYCTAREVLVCHAENNSCRDNA